MIHTKHTRFADFIDTNYQCHHICKHQVIISLNTLLHATTSAMHSSPHVLAHLRNKQTVNTQASINRNVETKHSPMQVFDLMSSVCVLYSSTLQPSFE